MQPNEQAVRRYIDAWFEPDRERRAQLLEACFAVGGRIAIGDRMICGRSELAATIDDVAVMCGVHGANPEIGKTLGGSVGDYLGERGS